MLLLLVLASMAFCKVHPWCSWCPSDQLSELKHVSQWPAFWLDNHNWPGLYLPQVVTRVLGKPQPWSLQAEVQGWSWLVGTNRKPKLPSVTLKRSRHFCLLWVVHFEQDEPKYEDFFFFSSSLSSSPKQVTGSTDVAYMQLDLSSLKSVRSFTETFLKTESKLDVLINNAGNTNVVLLMINIITGKGMHQWALCRAKLQQELDKWRLDWHDDFFHRSRGGRPNRRWVWNRVWRQPSWPLSADMPLAGPA